MENRKSGPVSFFAFRFSLSRRGLIFAAALTAIFAAVQRGAFPSGQTSSMPQELRDAGAMERAGRYEEAASQYQHFLEHADPAHTDPAIFAHARTRLATAFFLLHHYEDSLQALAPPTRQGGLSLHYPSQAWLVQGLDYLELNRPSEAIPPLRRALDLAPESGTARLALGDALVRTGQLEAGAQEYAEQTRRTPSVPDAWYKLGLAHEQLASQLSRDFGQEFPESVVGQLLAAEDLLTQGDFPHATGALFRLLRRAPNQPQVRANLGMALFEQGYPKAAEDQCRQELALDPDCPLARLGLAEAAALRGDWAKAISDLGSLARSHPHELSRLLEVPPVAMLLQAWNEGRIQLAERYVDSPMGKLWKAWLGNADSRPVPEAAANPSACSAPSSKAMATSGQWLSEACYRHLRNQLRVQKALTLKERIKLAEAEFRLGDFQAARQQAQLVLTADPRNEWGVYWLSRAEGELAEECFFKVAYLNPDSARVHEMLAQYYASRHNFPRAKAEYLAALHFAPDLPDLHLGLAAVCRAVGEWSEAEKELQRTLELTPGSALAHYQLGNSYVQERRWPAAVEQLQLALDDPALGVSARLDLAKAEEALGQTGQAIEVLAPILDKDKDGEVHYRLAGLYKRLGDKAHAQEALSSFKQLHDASLQVDRRDLEALEKERERVEHSAH
jgi:tetratricopeptide (TPR) repeat protein